MDNKAIKLTPKNLFWFRFASFSFYCQVVGFLPEGKHRVVSLFSGILGLELGLSQPAAEPFYHVLVSHLPLVHLPGM